ncbi:MAG: penicillin-binding protein [Rhodospirillaceae bacterium]|nr:penicillin-binding protein [Rhodospirillaceae bacterium]HAA90873.1 penicillin-binding protein [Rhodospirillaceae bacterium]
MGNPKGKKSAKDEAEKKPRKRRRAFLRFGLTITLWGVIGLGALLGWHALTLPDIRNLEQASARQASVQILARDGSPIARYGNLYGKPVLLKELPPTLSQAVLATEDRRFYSHIGVDVIGVARALLRNLKAGRIRQGGSTITQQLAKNLFLTQERTLSRKIRETLLAFWLEYRFSKDQILTIYLNRVYLGAGVYGVDAAAHTYFGKSARKLTLYETAVIAGSLKAPTRYNPTVYPKRAARRANQVLRNMVAAGWLSKNSATSQYRKTVRTARRHAPRANLRYFADWVMRRANGFLGGLDTDLIIRTTLDQRLQRSAEKRLASTLRKAKSRQAKQAAVLAMAPDGAVRVMVGGADYGTSQFNRTVQARRQPGSAFKLFVYLAALENGMRPDQRVRDVPVAIDGWSPRNHNRKHRGEMTLREGVARSSNAIAVAIAEQVGRDKVLQAARRLGVASPLGSDPSLALGVYEMTLAELVAAYGVFANGGRAVEPFGILDIRGADGRVLYRRAQAPPLRLVAKNSVRLINDLLHAAVDWGTGRAARLAHPAAGKTGTSQGHRDAWFIGYTGHLTTGVWMGNDDARSMKKITGGSLPARLWKEIMRDAHRNLPVRSLPGVASKVSRAR